MNPTAVESRAVPAAWEMLYAPVADELRRTEDVLRRELRNRHAFVDELVRHSFRLGGKRLRPALLLLSAQALGTPSEAHITLAAVVEMIHTATLVHDDVLDEASSRRHLPTINALWNNEASVLTGDYLFSHAFYLAATLDSAYACQVIGKATNTVCEGELRQVNSRGNLELSEDEYLQIIGGKTAALCACCCRLGARYANASPDMVEAFHQYGYELGLAFQIADDILDVTGDESTAGKSLGTDLEKQKMTLPWIRLRDSASAAERPLLLERLRRAADGDRGDLSACLAASDALDYSRARAEQAAAAARAALAPLSLTPAKRVLEALTESVVRRMR